MVLTELFSFTPLAFLARLQLVATSGGITSGAAASLSPPGHHRDGGCGGARSFVMQWLAPAPAARLGLLSVPAPDGSFLFLPQGAVRGDGFFSVKLSPDNGPRASLIFRGEQYEVLEVIRGPAPVI